MRIVLYARASTEDQSITLEAQQAKLEQFAALHDFEAVATILDAGQSGKSLNRAGLQQALAMLRSGRADGIAILRLDRLTRSVADLANLIDEYFSEKAGKQLFSVQDSINTTTASGRLVLHILGSVSQWERESIGERTRSALQHKIGRLQRVGRVRFGYDLAEDGVSLVPNEVEQAALAIIVGMRQAGHTLRSIAEALTSRQIRTKDGLATWSHSTVAYILKGSRAAA
jgi:DNA invertase Pin-like site-specific DNA recombinase